MKFTYGHVLSGIGGIALLGFIDLINDLVQCHSKTCEQGLGQLSSFGIGLALFMIVFGVFIPYFKSISPKNIRDELAEESGPVHGTLPKGYEQQDKKEGKK